MTRKARAAHILGLFFCELPTTRLFEKLFPRRDCSNEFIHSISGPFLHLLLDLDPGLGQAPDSFVLGWRSAFEQAPQELFSPQVLGYDRILATFLCWHLAFGAQDLNNPLTLLVSHDKSHDDSHVFHNIFPSFCVSFIATQLNVKTGGQSGWFGVTCNPKSSTSGGRS